LNEERTRREAGSKSVNYGTAGARSFYGRQLLMFKRGIVQKKILTNQLLSHFSTVFTTVKSPSLPWGKNFSLSHSRIVNSARLFRIRGKAGEEK
jgi:hypothetical protein